MLSLLCRFFHEDCLISRLWETSKLDLTDTSVAHVLSVFSVLSPRIEELDELLHHVLTFSLDVVSSGYLSLSGHWLNLLFGFYAS